MIWIKNTLLKLLFVLIFLGLYGCGKQVEKILANPVSVNSSKSIDIKQLKWNSVAPLVISFPNTKKPQAESIAYRVVSEWNSAIGRSFITYRFTDYNENISSKNYLATQNALRVYFKQRGQWADISNENSALALTFVSYIGENIQDADIIFNGNYDFSYVDNVNLSEFDFESVLLHEVGHFIGAYHISGDEDPDSIMRTTLFTGQKVRSLSNGDIQRIKTKY